eukprot:12890763-Prorocentrum_lima.AAC.1
MLGGRPIPRVWLAIWRTVMKVHIVAWAAGSAAMSPLLRSRKPLLAHRRHGFLLVWGAEAVLDARGDAIPGCCCPRL